MAKTSTTLPEVAPAPVTAAEVQAPKPKIVLAKPVKTEEAPKAEPPNPMRIRRIKF